MDAFLIDDNPFVRSAWQQTFAERGRNIVVYADSQTFVAEGLFKTYRDAPIFVDVELSDGISGLDLARWLHEREGHKNIFLTTCHDSSQFGREQFIAGIIDKNPPQWLFQRSYDIKKLGTVERRELLTNMTAELKQQFTIRIAQFYDAIYGNEFGSLLLGDGTGQFYPELVIDAWERGIYESLSDYELERVIQFAWTKTYRDPNE